MITIFSIGIVVVIILVLALYIYANKHRHEKRTSLLDRSSLVSDDVQPSVLSVSFNHKECDSVTYIKHYTYYYNLYTIVTKISP